MKVSSTAERLKEIMNEHNYRQVDILNICEPYCKKYNVKLGKNDLSQYVNGKVEPGQEKLTILSLALNVNPVWLMGYDIPKERDSVTICNHKDIDDEVLYAIQILASKCNYKFSIFAKQYQLENDGTVVPLSLKQVNDYKESVIEQVKYVTNCIFSNRLRDNIVRIKDDIIVNAAHEIPGATEEEKQHDEDIMNDENF